MTAGVKEKYDKLIDEGLCVQKRWGEPEMLERRWHHLLTEILCIPQGK